MSMGLPLPHDRSSTSMNSSPTIVKSGSWNTVCLISYVHQCKSDRWQDLRGGIWGVPRTMFCQPKHVWNTYLFSAQKLVNWCTIFWSGLRCVCIQCRWSRCRNGTLTKWTYVSAIHHTYLSICSIRHLFRYLWHTLPGIRKHFYSRILPCDRGIR